MVFSTPWFSRWAWMLHFAKPIQIFQKPIGATVEQGLKGLVRARRRQLSEDPRHRALMVLGGMLRCQRKARGKKFLPTLLSSSIAVTLEPEISHLSVL